MSRRVIVKYADLVPLPDDPPSPELMLDVPGFGEMSSRFPGLRSRRRLNRRADQWSVLINRAKALHPGYKPPEFRNFVTFEVPEGLDPGEVAKGVRDRAGEFKVERVYVEPPPMPPPTPGPVSTTGTPTQGYLESAAQGGIDVRYAWDQAGGRGDGQRLVDLEWGWDKAHPDLASLGIEILTGDVYGALDHGTAVLGVVAAGSYAGTCSGIAPALGSVRCASPWYSGQYDLVTALLDSIYEMSVGDVLLLEMQNMGYGFAGIPVETDPTTMELVRLATAVGIVVVEAAGNDGTANLDDLKDESGSRFMNPADPAFRDSGAILVAAGTSTSPHTRNPGSCHGARIDCFAWGDSVYTLGSVPAQNQSPAYTTPIDRTSSAAAIVAGAALILQGLAAPNRRLPLTSQQVRSVLGDRERGTRPASTAELIGVMPDLRKIIEDGVLASIPDTYGT